MNAADAVRLLNGARGANHIVDWHLSVGTAGAVLRFTTTVILRNRKKDGTLGRRRGQIWYSDSHVSPEEAIIRAAQFVVNNVQEVVV